MPHAAGDNDTPTAAEAIAPAPSVKINYPSHLKHFLIFSDTVKVNSQVCKNQQRYVSTLLQMGQKQETCFLI